MTKKTDREICDAAKHIPFKRIHFKLDSELQTFREYNEHFTPYKIDEMLDAIDERDKLRKRVKKLECCANCFDYKAGHCGGEGNASSWCKNWRFSIKEVQITN